MNEDTTDAAIHDALPALTAECAGAPSLRESVGVIAAQMIVNGDILKRVLVEIQALNAGISQR